MASLSVGGVVLDYSFAGPPGAPVVVFSNSLGTTRAMWAPQVAALSRRFRCLTYDTRGHGASAVVAAPVTVEGLAADLAGLLDGLGIARAHVVGLSLGGMTGQALAVSRPDLVDRLVLLATSARMAPPEAWHERAALVRRAGMAAIVDAILGRWFTPAADPAAVAPVREGLLAIAPEGYARCCEAIAAMDLTGAIAAIRAPTLVISGADDPATPVAMQADIRARIPGAEHVVIANAAHLVNLEQAAATTRHIEAFLADGAFARGLANRKAVLGAEHVERSLAKAGPFAAPWQDFITRGAWGEIWGDASLPWKTRSLVTLAMMVALHREEEFKLHVRPALKNGVTMAELQALLLHAAIYAGVPAANAAFRWVREVLGEAADDGL